MGSVNSTRSVFAVIGAQFGDEGKGLMTDYLARTHTSPIVVRFNGGAQAGHTVESPTGHRHVFHHFGSGTLAGAPTFLSRFFIVNPMTYAGEKAHLARAGLTSLPDFFFDPDCYLTLPWDMLINQEVERARGQSRHGSCGMGINETVTRCKMGRGEFLTTIGHDVGLEDRKKAYKAIRSSYHIERIKTLGLNPPDEFWQVFYSDRLLEDYLANLSEFLTDNVAIEQPADLIGPSNQSYQTVIFEGAQGLLLDEYNKQYFPNVTRSRTGLANVVSLMEEVGTKSVEPIYLSRAYTTRHGAGLFPTEIPGLSYPDLTNQPNPFQGTLRFGYLDVKSLIENVRSDLIKTIQTTTGITVTPSIGLTCLNQVGNDVPVGRNADGTPVFIDMNSFVRDVQDASSSFCGALYLSSSPTYLGVNKAWLGKDQVRVK